MNFNSKFFNIFLLVPILLSSMIGCAEYKKPAPQYVYSYKSTNLQKRATIAPAILTNESPLDPDVKEDEFGPGVQLYTYATQEIDEELEKQGVQVPVPRDCRILNTKGNCVWCSLELLARYAEIKELYGITRNVRDGGDPRCQGGSSPTPVRQFLNSKKIRYEMSADGDKRNGELLLIKGCKIERRGAAFAIPGHMLNIISYEPENKLVKVIDNADRSLSVQTWSIEKFQRLWTGWTYIVYREPDLVPDKYMTPADKIPIKDQNNPQGTYPRGYIPSPRFRDE